MNKNHTQPYRKARGHRPRLLSTLLLDFSTSWIKILFPSIFYRRFMRARQLPDRNSP